MTNRSTTVYPLISVIIPCYNHGVYLAEALASIQRQEYPAVEVVVVDDGSTDDTEDVAQRYPWVRYIYQTNQGLSAARNTGIAHSTGQYLVFLDADDWLLPEALKTNAQWLQQNAALAFVSGGHDKVLTATGKVSDDSQEVATDHYLQLLQGNYIGMHAAVMYHRWVFDEFAYDTSLDACEDYDLYLRIARAHPIAHHTQRIAAYRLHSTNMSGNVPLMLSTVLTALSSQQPHLRTPREKQAYVQGRAIWKHYYGQKLYDHLSVNERAATKAELLMLLEVKPFLLTRYLSDLTAAKLKKLLKRYIPNAGLKLLHKAGMYKNFLPAVGRVATGDFARLAPFSTEFGYDRGGPVDRYYIENFLRGAAAAIRGRVLEIGDNEYTLQFGQAVTQSDILHVDVSNPYATFIGDLSHAPHLPDNGFDCIVLTQTLHLIYEYRKALVTCHRILKPGGTLLLTVPGITPIDHGEWKKTWYWSFTDSALHRLLAETFPVETTEIQSFGNVFIASAFLYGLGRSEVTKEQLDHYDPQFQIINAVKAVKA
ncbi:glycosyltransferase [Hymenobacter sp. UV11]|uniref:glycosyltransferase n=1 Tax=Hymenobacter sp. UV11 TaxID=1849735 RepID=UPI00105FB46F|nr:glycosyltransferase [Hymenobacter sp. UV11]TDN39604.1 glycosyl transferase family 2 [Hymenobacter sp. UV11]TFZ63351.1 glycosyltransferase [Hymenobacter sp. UV11]